MVSPEFDPYDEECCYDFGANDLCPLCDGTGQINALTKQSYIYVASYADCPMCDGTGEAP